jgi:hypothetical protein
MSSTVGCAFWSRCAFIHTTWESVERMRTRARIRSSRAYIQCKVMYAAIIHAWPGWRDHSKTYPWPRRRKSLFGPGTKQFAAAHRWPSLVGFKHCISLSPKTSICYPCHHLSPSSNPHIRGRLWYRGQENGFWEVASKQFMELMLMLLDTFHPLTRPRGSAGEHTCPSTKGITPKMSPTRSTCLDISGQGM